MFFATSIGKKEAREQNSHGARTQQRNSMTNDGWTSGPSVLAMMIVKEKECYDNHSNNKTEPGRLYCPVLFDTVTCWHATPAGIMAYRPCPTLTWTGNETSSRMCYENGTWDSFTNYKACVLPFGWNSSQNSFEDLPILRVINLVGFSISTVALVLALAIFCYFRSLRCLRNVIHCNLILSFIMRNTIYIIMKETVDSTYDTELSWLCKVKTTLHQYVSTATFLWMFVEGVYLFSMVVWAFTASKIKFWHYACIGWVIPIVIVMVWVVVKITVDNDPKCWLPYRDHNYVDYIVHTPVIIALLCNVVFLTVIVWVLLTKLRASNSLETRQFRKATRAIVVLFPLLGMTYLLMFYGPPQTSDFYVVFRFINTILMAVQGLVVAVCYCFLNGEVQTLLRKKLSSIRDSRGLFTRHTKSSFVGSPARSSFHALSMTTCNGRASINGDDGRNKEEMATNNTVTSCTEVTLRDKGGYSHDDEEAVNML